MHKTLYQAIYTALEKNKTPLQNYCFFLILLFIGMYFSKNKHF